jgi:hypothetical protein
MLVDKVVKRQLLKDGFTKRDYVVSIIPNKYFETFLN